MKKIALLLSTLALGCAAQAQTPVPITASSLTYTQDFNTLVNSGTASTNTTLPSGWAIFEKSTGTADYRVSDGTTTNGDTYSFGTTAATDRALGSIASNALQSLFGAKFINNTGAAITGFTITYKGEQWRLGVATTHTDSLLFQYSTAASSVGDTAAAISWTTVNSLMFNSVVSSGAAAGILDGNLSANSITKTGTVALSIPNGSAFVIRWADVNIAGTDDGLAVDDVSITFTTGTPPVVTSRPNVLTLVPNNGAANVAANANLQITFDRTVTGNATGSIYIKNETDQTTVTKAGNSADVTVSGQTVTIANTGLAIGKAYHVTFDSSAFDTAGAKSYGIYDTTAWHFAVPMPNYRPTITPIYPTDNATSLPANAAETLRMRFSRRVVKGTAGNITIKNETDQTVVTKSVTSADVTLNATGDTAFVANVALVAGKAYHVLVDSIAFDTAGYRVVGITDSTRWNFSVQGPLVTVTALNEQFETGCATGQLPSGWSQVSVSGTATWRCNTSASNYALVMNGGGTTSSTANEDWLITPQLNLAGQSNPMLAFRGKYRFAGQDMQVKYSTNYSGVGDPNAASWSDVQGISFTTADSNRFVTKTASLPAAQLFVAFKYTSSTATPSDGREWSVDSVVVANNTTGINTVNSRNNTLGVQVIGAATNGHVMVAFDLANSAAVTASIYDLAGREVFAGSYNAVKGANTLNLQPQSLQSGMYIIRVSNGKEMGIARTFIQ